MRITALLSLTAISLALSITACGGKKKDKNTVALKSEKDSASYAVGIIEAKNLLDQMQRNGADSLLDVEMLLNGYNDYIHKHAQFSPEQTDKILNSFFGKLRDQQMQKFQSENAPKKEAAVKFMAENKNKPGVMSTASGLQYEVIKKGTGANIAIGDVVTVHYTGTLTDGSKFDSSVDKGQPFEFEVNPTGGLVQGWIEAIQLMNKGAKYKIYIPYELGYGDMGQSPVIPPYSDLIFELEVLDVKKK